jgi:glucose dehydrogenase
MEEDTNLTHAEVLARLRSNRFIVGIPFAALVADLLGRVLSDFDVSVVRPLESLIFVIAGLSFLMAAHLEKRHTLRTYRIEIWLALVFVLGALRDGLWAAGMNIQDVNIIILTVGVAGGACVYFWMKRSSDQRSVKR